MNQFKAGKVKIKNMGEGLKQFNGVNGEIKIAASNTGPSLGKSGKTVEVSVGNGGALYLTADQFDYIS